MKLGIANKYPDAVKAAKARLAALNEAAKCEQAIAAAIKNRDIESLGIALARATELGIENSEAVRGGLAKRKVSCV